jgi:hypothetical protein
MPETLTVVVEVVLIVGSFELDRQVGRKTGV